MNLKKFYLSVFALFSLLHLNAQRIGYSYDDNGNRTGRTLVTEQLKSNSVSFPVINQKNLKSLENIQGTGSYDEQSEKETINQAKRENGEIKTNVFPNPTTGMIKVQVENMPFNATNEIRVYDLAGKTLIVKKDFESSTDIDLSKLRDGIYILRIKIEDNWYDWKVVKNH